MARKSFFLGLVIFALTAMMAAPLLATEEPLPVAEETGVSAPAEQPENPPAGAPVPEVQQGQRGDKGDSGPAGIRGPHGPRGQRGPAGSDAKVPDLVLSQSHGGHQGVYQEIVNKKDPSKGWNPASISFVEARDRRIMTVALIALTLALLGLGYLLHRRWRHHGPPLIRVGLGTPGADGGTTRPVLNGPGISSLGPMTARPGIGI